MSEENMSWDIGGAQITHAMYLKNPTGVVSYEALVMLIKFQERSKELEKCISFFVSVIKAGEAWTPTCESMLASITPDSTSAERVAKSEDET
jgi:hypothetical protein